MPESQRASSSASSQGHTTFQVEVNVAAFVMTHEGYVLNDDVVDVTLGFGARMGPLPPEVDDAIVQGNLAKWIAPVLAAIRVALTSYGMAYVGEIDESVLTTTHRVGTGVTPPVRVVLSMGDGPEHKA